MPLQLPADLEELVRKRLASGGYANAEDVVRRALEAQDVEECWSVEDRAALDAKIDSALQQVSAGKVYGPDQAREKLAGLRSAHLAKLSR
jgi:Arc/MetJ-type ribon-helix-helix transcriptional regulator